MESNLLMSRRDVVVNTLLGFLIITAAVVLFLLFVGAAALVLWSVDYLAKRYFPGVVHRGSLAVSVIFGVSSLVAGVGHLRRRRWRNAFLSLTVVPLVASIWFADTHSPFGRDRFTSIWLALIVLFTPQDSLLPRSQFFLGALIAGAVVAINCGLFGSEVFAHAISGCILLAAFILLVIQGRRRWSSGEPHSDASPTVA
jgi:hypothetical protein